MFLRALLRSIAAVALLAAGFAAGWLASAAYGGALPPAVARALRADDPSTTTPAAARAQFGAFWEVWDLLGSEYYGRATLDRARLVQGAIKGMLAATGDQYSVYQEPDLAAQTQDHLQGKLGGIGTYLRITDGRAYLYKPFKTGPAYQAGLRQDDEIVAVDGSEVAKVIVGLDTGAAAVKVAALLRGPEGTAVKLTVRRAADGATLDVPLTRRDIVVPSVEAQTFEGGVAYLRIAEFKGNTTGEFDDALADLLAKRPTALVLDLRNNPGGLLSSAQEVLGRFYDGVALYEEDGVGGVKELRTTTPAPGGPKVPAIPVVVLVNGGSASASEIVAGGLAERRSDAVLLGEKTYGKGSVQNVHTLRDGGSARITVAHWLTPDRHAISGAGLQPRYPVAFADDPASPAPCVADRQPAAGQSQCGDTQLAAAIRLARTGRP